MRGRGEGHNPWDYEPNSTMTNATVAQETAGVDGQTLTLKYKDGEQKVIVSPTTTIVTFASKSIADLKPGQKSWSSPRKNFRTARWKLRTFSSAITAFGDNNSNPC